MTAPKTKYPIESFGPELMAALLRGSRERLVIPFPGESGKRLAHAFQRRIHTLRQRMRELEHPQYMLAARARVSIFWGEKAVGLDPSAKDWTEDHNGHRGALIVIQPNDSEFTDVLAKVGVTIDNVPDISLPNEPVATLEDLLDELVPGSKKPDVQK